MDFVTREEIEAIELRLEALERTCAIEVPSAPDPQTGACYRFSDEEKAESDEAYEAYREQKCDDGPVF